MKDIGRPQPVTTSGPVPPMTTKATLLALAERVEAASGADRELDARLAEAVNPKLSVLPDGTGGWLVYQDGWRVNADASVPAYTASLDAAMTLAGDDLFVTIIRDPGGIGYAGVSAHPSNTGKPCATPALALTAAALRTRAS